MTATQTQVKHIVISENRKAINLQNGDTLTVSPEEYIENRAAVDLKKNPRLKIINLCKSYDYLSKGYYCSLLAEARGQRCIPPVESVIQMNWKRLYYSVQTELNHLLDKHYKQPLEQEIAKTYLFYFGRAENPKLEFLSRRIFDTFRFPLLSVTLKYQDNHWTVGDILPVNPAGLPPEKINVFLEALDAFTGNFRVSKKKPAQEKFWLGVLQDPHEKFPPSDRGALESLIRVAKKKNVYTELITREDMATILEYDALFIRETTAIDNHTYRFAFKAEQEGIPCIDDTQSIIRCSNKVFLNEALASKNLPVPKTEILDVQTARRVAGDDLPYPLILKIPDGSFSRGIVKVERPADFTPAIQSLFKRSDLILMQEYLPSDFDWRIGILGGRPLFACRYFMAEGHWQIYNHSAKTKKKQEGGHETLAIEKVPKKVLDVATKAAALVGQGFYGVDLKENAEGVFVIEINDNPNVDKDVEDRILGDNLYAAIIDHFAMLVEA